MSRKQSWNLPSSAGTYTYSREIRSVEEFKKYVQFIPTEHEITNRLLGIGCEYQKGLKAMGSKDCLATGPDVRLLNPRAKGNWWDEKVLKQRAKIRKEHSVDFVAKQNVG